MRRQKCAQCGTMLDISKLQSGSKFACASCGAILVVGEATAVKKSLKESGPAFTPKDKASTPPPAPSRRRAAEPTGERPSRRGTEEAGAKSKMPLFIGLGVVAVGAVVAIVLATGNGGGAGGTKGESAVQWWARQEPRLAALSANELRSVLDEGRAKYGGDQAFWSDKEGRIQDALLRKDPTDTQANVRKGNKDLREFRDFDAVWQQIETSKETPAELQEYFDDLGVKPGKSVWLSPAKYAEASGKIEEFVAWKRKLDENPAAEPTERFIRTAKPLLSSGPRKVGFASVAEAPFVLLLAYEEGEDAAKASAAILGEGKKWGAALKVLHEEFDRKIREPLGLPAIEAGKYYCNLVVPTADDLGKFAREGEGLDAVGDVLGFFSLRTKWAVLRAPGEASEKALFGGDLAHEAFHQLQWHYSGDPVKKLENYMEQWHGIWLSEGLAEFLGGGIDLDPASGKATFSGKPPRRIEFLRGMRDNGVPPVPVRELVQLRPDNYDKNLAHWISRIGDREDLPEAAAQWIGTQDGVTSKLLYAHGWLLVHFLHEAEEGKYRAKLMDLVLTALRGGRKPERYRKDAAVVEKFGSADEAFAEILGLKDDAQWKDIEQAYERHLKKIRGD
jgi:DNA-directed RNA polymerase subunit RPC12/RpoP